MYQPHAALDPTNAHTQPFHRARNVAFCVVPHIVKVLVRPRRWASSPEHSLFAYVKSTCTFMSWAGLNVNV